MTTNHPLHKYKYINFKKLIPSNIYTWIFLAITIFIGSITIYRLFSYDMLYGWSHTTYQDFLFNFGGGFIRRGLTGEILIMLKEIFGLEPLPAICLSSLASYLFLGWVFLRYFYRNGYSPMVLLLGCCLGGAFIYQFHIMRRDYIELALLAIVLLLYNRLSFKQWTIVGNLILIFGILLHEATAFFTIPIIVLISLKRSTSLFKSTMLWLPVILTFLLCCLFKGSSEIFEGMMTRAHSIFPEAFIENPTPYLLSFACKRPIEVFCTHFIINFSAINDFSALHIPVPAWCVTLFFIFYIPYITIATLLAFTIKQIDRNRISHLVSIIIFQFIWLLPMFTLLSCDLSRVGTYWILSSLMIWLIIPENDLFQIFNKYQNFTTKLTDKIFYRWRPGKLPLSLMILFIGIPAVIRSIFYINYNSIFHTIMEDIQLLINNGATAL